MKYSIAVSIMYFVCGGLWALEFLWSLWTVKLVYWDFRGKGAARLASSAAPSVVCYGEPHCTVTLTL